MTDVSLSDELWNVFILSGAKPTFFQFAPTTTVCEIRQRWESHIQQVGAFRITACDGSRLMDNMQLSDIGEVAIGSKTVNLVAEKATKIFLKPYGSEQGDVKIVAVDLSQTTSELRQQVVEMFEVPEDRIFRLISDSGPLENRNQSLDQQGVMMDSVIQIDYGYSVDIIDELADTIDKRIVFSSEDAAYLLEDSDDCKRLMLGRRIVDLTGDFYSALAPIYRKMMHLTLEIQTKHEVTVLVNKCFTQTHVWPSSIVQKALPKPASKTRLKFEGKPISKRKSPKEMNLPNHALLYTTIRVPVKLSCGKWKIFDVADQGTVSDLTVQVQSIEESDKFVLKSGDRVLEGQDLISKALSGKAIVVERLIETVTVQLHDRCVRWQRAKPKLRFTDIMNILAEKGQIEAVEAADLVLECQGCGRRLKRAEEKNQIIPADCCRVRSLELSEYQEPKMRDGMTQGRCTSADGVVQEKSIGHRPATTRVKTQSSNVKNSALLQHPQVSFLSDDDKNSWKFRLCNKYVDALPGEDKPVDVDLALNPGAKVKDVRNMISKLLNLDRAHVKLYRWVGYTSSRGVLRRRTEVYDVYCKKQDWFGFSDVGGTKYQWRDVAEREEICLDDLNALFPIVMPFRNFLTVSPH